MIILDDKDKKAITIHYTSARHMILLQRTSLLLYDV